MGGGNPELGTQGNRLSCRDQEGRRGSEEAVPAHYVLSERRAVLPAKTRAASSPRAGTARQALR